VTEYTMLFGKWKGQAITEVPDGALRHYLEWQELRSDAAAAIKAELERRSADTGVKVKTMKPNAARLTRGSAPRVVVPASSSGGPVERCAFDLIAAGEGAMLAQFPGREGIIRDAAELLRGRIQTPAPVSAATRADDEVPF
jgi:hypothetical protein